MAGPPIAWLAGTLTSVNAGEQLNMGSVRPLPWSAELKKKNREMETMGASMDVDKMAVWPFPGVLTLM